MKWLFLKLCVGPAEPAVSWVWHVRFSFVTPRWSRQGNRGGSAQPGRTPGDCRLWGELWDRHPVPGRESPVPIKKTFLPPSARTEVGRGCEKIYCARISRCIPRRAKQGHSLALASRRCSESLCISYIHSGCSSQPWDSSLRGLRPFRSRRNGSALQWEASAREWPCLARRGHSATSLRSDGVFTNPQAETPPLSGRRYAALALSSSQIVTSRAVTLGIVTSRRSLTIRAKFSTLGFSPSNSGSSLSVRSR